MLASTLLSILLRYVFEEDDLIAVIEWVNTIDMGFDGLETSINIYNANSSKIDAIDSNESNRRKRSNEVQHVYLLYHQTKSSLPLAKVGWNSQISLQPLVGDHWGEESERIQLFSEALSLDPPMNIVSTVDNINGSLVTKLEWEFENPNTRS